MIAPVRPSWARDSSLCFRVKDSVETMLRGRHDFNRRMKTVMTQLRPLRPSDFPGELRFAFEVVLAADDLALVEMPPAANILAYGRMTSSQRDIWFDALLTIYKAIVIDRHLIGRTI